MKARRQGIGLVSPFLRKLNFLELLLELLFSVFLHFSLLTTSGPCLHSPLLERQGARGCVGGPGNCFAFYVGVDWIGVYLACNEINIQIDMHFLDPSGLWAPLLESKWMQLIVELSSSEQALILLALRTLYPAQLN